jgi:uncharacterized membrane protein
MKKQNYIQELENKLAHLESNTKREILNEIQSYINESNASYDTLIEKFGQPQELANSYLEDMPTITPIKEKASSIISKTFKILGALLLLFISIVVYFIYTHTSDDFDYSKYTANTINNKINIKWIKIQNIENIQLNQAKAVIYWSNINDLEYSCKGSDIQVNSNTLAFKKSFCYVKVPKILINIESFQSNVVLVEPTANIILDSTQSKIRIANLNSSYNYKLKSKSSDTESLNSDNKSKIIIQGNVTQSSVKLYSY